MSSKQNILHSIRGLNLDAQTLPEMPEFDFDGDLISCFKSSIESNKGVFSTETELQKDIESGKYAKIFSTDASYESASNYEFSTDAHDFQDLDLAIIKGQFGVAENGAIWLEDADLNLRAIPFITQHLVILLEEKNLVTNMHAAYEKIGESHSGFGLFIAGPSKTADIEQSLVIGAHGARSLKVILRNAKKRN